MKTAAIVTVALRIFLIWAALLPGASMWGAPLALTQVADIPLPGNTTRFDYQSFDSQNKRLFFSHMGDGELVVFDTVHHKVISTLPGFPTDTAVLVIPAIHRVFVSVAGNHEIAAVDSENLKTIARIPDGEFPDGIAYAPEVGRIFVSDESGGKETVIDVKTNKRIASIDIGGEIGNTQYDSFSKHVLMNVQTKGELVEVDPNTIQIIGRHHLEGADGNHGLLIHPSKRLAFVACEGSSKLLVVNLETFQVQDSFSTGEGPDVLAFDPTLERLYVACESGVVSIFHVQNTKLEKIEDLNVGPHAHTVSVNPETHELYFPLKNIDGQPVLRIMKPIVP